MRIFYLCPDISFPSGGVKTLYDHVQILQDNGYDAYILHSAKGFKLSWFDHSVPVIYLTDKPMFGTRDTIVLTEVFPNMMKQLKPFNKVVIALNPLYIFHSMPLGENWKSYGVEWVMTSSTVIKDLIEWSMGIENIYVIGTSIDHDMFNFNYGKKRLQIAYISRKDTLSPVAEKMIISNDRLFKHIDFVRIENLHFKDYAEVLKESEIYLTTQPFEGLNISVLEAMACGCICIGFHGIGGRDYIVGSGAKQNFVLVESMDFIELSRSLTALITMAKEYSPLIETIRKNGFATASLYTKSHEKETVLQFWSKYCELRR